MMEFPCIVCDSEVRPRQHAVSCDSCSKWQHRLCDTGISLKLYKAAVRGSRELSFVCRQCSQPNNTEGQGEVSNLDKTYLIQSRPAEIPVTHSTRGGPNSQDKGAVNTKLEKTPSKLILSATSMLTNREQQRRSNEVIPLPFMRFVLLKEGTLTVSGNIHQTEKQEIEQNTLSSSTVYLNSTDSKESVYIRHRPVNKQHKRVIAKFLCSSLSSDSSGDSDESTAIPQRVQSSRNTTQAIPTSRFSSSSSDSSSDSDDSSAFSHRFKNSINNVQVLDVPTSRFSSSSSESSSDSDDSSDIHQRFQSSRNKAQVIPTSRCSSPSSDSSSDSDNSSAIPHRFKNRRNKVHVKPNCRLWSPFDSESSEIRRQQVTSRPTRIPLIDRSLPETASNSGVDVSDLANMKDVTITYRVIQNGSTRGNDLLTDTHGYTYCVKKRNYSRTYWRCSVRSKNLMCRAAVTQRRNSFWTSPSQHNHPPYLNRAKDAELCAKIRIKVQTASSPHKTASSIIEETAGNLNSPISKDRMTTLIRRTNGIRARHRRATATEQCHDKQPETNYPSTTQKLLQPPRETPVKADTDCIRGGEEHRPF